MTPREEDERDLAILALLDEGWDLDELARLFDVDVAYIEKLIEEM